MEPEFAHIVETVRNRIGDGLERVIVYGSYVWGNHQPESDIDIAILIADDVKLSAYDFIKAIDRPFSLYVCSARKADSLRRFRVCMDAKIVNDGIVLFDSGRRFDALDADAARSIVVAEHLKRATDALRRTLKDRRFLRLNPNDTLAEYSAMSIARQSLCAAAFGLQAYLLDQNIEVSHKKLRWSVDNLIEAAAWFDTSWRELKPLGEVLKAEYQFPGDIENGQLGQAETEAAARAALQIYRKARKELKK